MTYALGRRVESFDMPTVRAIVRDAAQQDYRISAFIQGVVNEPGVPDEPRRRRRRRPTRPPTHRQ